MMENSELIEKYVRGQMEASERLAFENQLHSDPSLQSDVALQKQIVEGIKKVRIAELKAVLNQVPVGGSMPYGVAAGKIVTGIIAVGAVVTGSLLYLKPWPKTSVPVTKTETPLIKNKTVMPADTVATPEPKDVKAAASPIESKPKKEVTATKAKAVQPKIDVMDPTEELTKTTADKRNPAEVNKAGVMPSRITVETESSNPKYSFHYQFSQGKLILYGNFDKNLYEIIEVHGDAHAVFLFFKENYYILNEKQSMITPLIPIKDLQLIKKLKDYRSK
jgi:hypothetical protein